MLLAKKSSLVSLRPQEVGKDLRSLKKKKNEKNIH